MKTPDKKLKEKLLKIQELNEKKQELEVELEKIDKELKAILSKEKLISYDPQKNIYLLNVNFRA